jgi:DNA processing protein
MPYSDEHKARLALVATYPSGSSAISYMIAAAGTACLFLKEPERFLCLFPESRQREVQRIIDRVQKLDILDLADAELARCEKEDIRVLIPSDNTWPIVRCGWSRLPLVLFVKGLNEPITSGLAIVGARKTDYYGERLAHKYAFAIATAGITVISGGAIGIDTAAHRGALDALATETCFAVRTIAVLGSGFGHLYPPANEPLFHDIAENGWVMTEFPYETEPLNYHFPKRNRLIAALSSGVLIVRASENSGSLITARLARAYGRPVFAIPGPVESPLSRGGHRLIQQGKAKMVSSPADLMASLSQAGLLKTVVHDFQKPTGLPTKEIRGKRRKNERIIVDILDEVGVSVDDIIHLTHLDPKIVADVLVDLELNGDVKELPGSRFCKII